MASWQAIVGGNTYNLSDRNPFDLVSATGIGIAPVRRLTQRGPLQHGETDVGYRLDPRTINLVLVITTGDRALSDAARQTLAYIFGPRESEPIKLRCTRDDGAVRQIDCRSMGTLDVPITDDTRIWDFQRVGVQLVASNPFWYDPMPNSPQAVVSQGAWFIPFEVPFEFGAQTTMDTAFSVPYDGTADEYPIIRIEGELDDPVLTNTTTGDVLDFTGVELANGEYLEIDLAYGRKTVVDQTGANQIALLTPDSDLATWRLASILETGNGVNALHFEAANAASGAGATIYYSNRYISL